MNGKYIRLTPPPVFSAAPPQFAQFDPKTLYLVDGAAPIVIGRASKHPGSGRPNDPDRGYLRVPTGQTALGAHHALLCLRNGTLYIAMQERDGMISQYEGAPTRQLSPHSEYMPLRSGARVRLGIAGATAPGVTLLVDIIFAIADTDLWLATAIAKKRFIRALPEDDHDVDMG